MWLFDYQNVAFNYQNVAFKFMWITLVSIDFIKKIKYLCNQKNFHKYLSI